jgi:uncharacterized Zn-finger protein
MNQKLILGGMNQKLIEIEEEDYIFYCNNCKNEFDHIISFYPIPGLTEYYNCRFCNSILPVKDLNKKNKNKNNFWNCCCFWL